MFEIVNDYRSNENDYLLTHSCGKAYLNSINHLFNYNSLLSITEEKGGEKLCASNAIDFKILKTARIDGTNNDVFTNIKISIYNAIKEAIKLNCKRIVMTLQHQYAEVYIKAFIEGSLIGLYSFDKYKTEKEEMPNIILVIAKDTQNQLQKQIDEITNVCKWTNIGRDLVNEPMNKLGVNSFVDYMNKTCKQLKTKTTVLDEKKLIQQSCGGIVAVGSGGKEKAKLFKASYSPANAKKHIALVGKGVVYDCGGLCVKSGKEQVESKLDMAGAAMMFGAFCSIVEQKLPIKVDLIIPVVENSISSSSYHVGDVLTMNNGVTVEVADTDAEGRLILADALSIASKLNPDIIADAATLTGSCCSGLGLDIAGVLTNNTQESTKLFEAAKNAGENMWLLPLHQDYDEKLKSEIADCKNYNHGGYGDVINSSLFLQKFVDNKNWIHIDIAGPGYQQEEYQHFRKGGKGFGIRTIIEFIKNYKWLQINSL